MFRIFIITNESIGNTVCSLYNLLSIQAFLFLFLFLDTHDGCFHTRLRSLVQGRVNHVRMVSLSLCYRLLKLKCDNLVIIRLCDNVYIRELYHFNF